MQIFLVALLRLPRFCFPKQLCLVNYTKHPQLLLVHHSFKCDSIYILLHVIIRENSRKPSGVNSLNASLCVYRIA